MALLVVFPAWLVYEVVMAVILGSRFTLNDWVALGYKLLFLSASLLLVYTGRLRLVCSIAPAYAGAVRAAGGWLSYTWFTVFAPLLGSLACINDGASTRRGVLANLVVSLFMAFTLVGRAYQAPSGIGFDMIVGFALGLASSLAIDVSGLRLVLPVVLVILSWVTL